jgi:signal transduction histidine kinase
MRLKAENALASGDAARHVAALESVLGQIARLDDLLRDLLATTQRSRLGLQNVDVDAYLAERVESFREVAQARGVRLESAAAPKLGRSWFDPEQIRRALDNLILNAVQNVPVGGCVQISASRDRNVLRLRVADNGPGVPEELRTRLFEPFVTGRADGTGLGLAIAREIARNHGGDIHLLGSAQGAAFELELPWRPRPEPS